MRNFFPQIAEHMNIKASKALILIRTSEALQCKVCTMYKTFILYVSITIL